MNAKMTEYHMFHLPMILRQQSYTISRSLTHPIFPCLTALLGERSFIHFHNATFIRLVFHLLSYSMQNYSSQKVQVWRRKDTPTFPLKEQELRTTLQWFQTKGVLCLLVSSLKKASIPPHFISLEPG